MATCPAGHSSESTDYCDVCGSPMDSSAAASTTAPAAPAGVPSDQRPMGVVCPNCEVMNAPGALFCEACGYDYTTGTMPRPAPPLSILDLDAPLAAGSDAPAPADQLLTPAPAPSQMQPSPPDPPDDAGPPDVPDGAGPPDESGPPDVAGPPDGVGPPDGAEADQHPTVSAHAAVPGATSPHAGGSSSDTGSSVGGTAGPEAESTTFGWVVEIWIDPEWYALQQSPDPMPSPGLPDIMPLRKRSLLIGRPSRSRNIHPDLDCEPDTGISRRQAELTTDGTRWFIEDLGSANGTFVADAAEAMPSDPIPTGRRHELNGDERIYLGAWTRLVLRRATPEEQEAYAAT